MTKEEEMVGVDAGFLNLTSMLASSVWCQLGKIQNPADGKINKNLQNARLTIEMLLMLRNKTKGNLTKKEETILNSTISNLQINYADEFKEIK
jgi:hypothetical protein